MTAIRTEATAARRVRPMVPLSLGYFMVILDATVVNVALPALGRGLHTGVSGLQWIVDAYTLVLAALLLAGGSLADRLGGRRVLQAGLALFSGASAACGLAPGVWFLVGARAVQGLGAALVVPASLALIRAAFSDSRARAHAFGVWAAVAGVAAASGPIVGGALVSAVGWRAVFLVNLPVGAAAMALTAIAVPAPPPRPARLDPAGQLLAIATLVLLTLALIDAGSLGWSAGRVLALFAAAVVALALFLGQERHTGAPMLPLWLFARGQLSAGTAVGFLINLGFYGELFVLSLYFQGARGYSAFHTGLAFLPLAATTSVSSALSGRVFARAGVRLAMLLGLLTGAGGLLLLALASLRTPYWLLVAPLALTGFGMAFTMPAATAAVVEAAPAERAGLAAGVVNAARQTGGTIGVALLGTLIGAGSVAARAISASGFRLATLAACAAFLVAAGTVLRSR
jgi:DHA2 family methylenomycin A resistance protein-like MFS transporter